MLFPAEATVQLQPGMDDLSLAIAFAPPARLTGDFVRFTVEAWLMWRSEESLQLVQPRGTRDPVSCVRGDPFDDLPYVRHVESITHA